MVVVRIGACLVTGATVTEIVPLDDAGIFKKAHGAIHGRNRDAVVNLGATAIKFFNVGMVVGFRQHARDHATLLSHSHPFGSTERLDILLFGDVFSRLGHVASLSSGPAGVRGLLIIWTVSVMCLLAVIKDRAGAPAQRPCHRGPDNNWGGAKLR